MKFTRVQEFLAEFFGTMVLILFGCGSVAMVVLFGSNPPIPGEVVKGVVGGPLGAFAYDLFIGKALIQANAVDAKNRASGEDPSHHEAAKR